MGGENGTLTLFKTHDASGAISLFKDPSANAITHLRFNPQQDSVLCVNADGSLRVWEGKRFTQQRVWSVKGQPIAIQFSEEGQLVQILTQDQKIYRYDLTLVSVNVQEGQHHALIHRLETPERNLCLSYAEAPNEERFLWDAEGVI